MGASAAATSPERMPAPTMLSGPFGSRSPPVTSVTAVSKTLTGSCQMIPETAPTFSNAATGPAQIGWCRYSTSWRMPANPTCWVWASPFSSRTGCPAASVTGCSIAVGVSVIVCCAPSRSITMLSDSPGDSRMRAEASANVLIG